MSIEKYGGILYSNIVKCQIMAKIEEIEVAFMVKKLFALLLVMAMLLSFAACGEDPTQPTTPSTPTQPTTPSESTDPSEDPSESTDPSEDPTESTDPSEDPTKAHQGDRGSHQGDRGIRRGN